METNRTYCDKYKDYIIYKREDIIDYRTAYMFPNNYGASVIHGYYSRGLELAVLYFDGDTLHLANDALFNDDVFGHIKDEAELEKLLDQIKELKGA
jgi:hypothetical protein|nr:MAG TPA: hypothetical protein [Caudoviricetes sp.]